VVIVCIAAALTPRSDVHADGLEIAFFNIEHDEETNALHIVHRFFQQDIEIALSGVAGKSILLVDNIATKQAVQPYIEERFSLSALDGTPLEPRWVNVEQRDGTLLIRQQSHLPASASGLVVRNVALLETHPKHVNIMHATLGGETFRRDFMTGGVTQKLIIDLTRHY
jgi:hypothetical protein